MAYKLNPFTRKLDFFKKLVWGDISGKPSTFPPSTHSHIISDVANLQSAIDAKVEAITLGRILYVSTSGNNLTATIGRIDKPDRNIQDAINRSSNGDLIYIFPGTYTENITTGGKQLSFILINANVIGNWNNTGGGLGRIYVEMLGNSKITSNNSGTAFHTFQMQEVIVNGGVIENTSTGVTATGFFNRCNNVKFISNNNDSGNTVTGTFNNCKFLASTNTAITLSSPSATAPAIFNNCQFYSNSGVTIRGSSGNENIFNNCLIKSNTNYALSSNLATNSIRGTFNNCQIYSNGTYVIGGEGYGSILRFKECTIAGNTLYQVSASNINNRMEFIGCTMFAETALFEGIENAGTSYRIFANNVMNRDFTVPQLADVRWVRNNNFVWSDLLKPQNFANNNYN